VAATVAVVLALVAIDVLSVATVFGFYASG
jgi:hypothetical protein